MAASRGGDYQDSSPPPLPTTTSSSSPSGGGDLPIDWTYLQYNNVAMGIDGSRLHFLEEDMDVEDMDDDEITLRLWFRVRTRRGTPPPSPEATPTWGVDHSTRFTIPLSQLSLLRGAILDLVLARPDLDDGYAEFLYACVGCFLQERMRRFLSSHSSAPTRIVMVEAAAWVVIDEATRGPAPEPQLKMVVYKEEEKEDAGCGEGRAPAPSPTAVREKACPICLLEFDVGEEVGVTPCAHPFHPACLRRWLEEKPFCPLCRSLIPAGVSSAMR